MKPSPLKHAPTVAPVVAVNDPLMTVKEVAQELRMSPVATRHMIYAGQLTAYYMAGRRIRVKRSDLDIFLATQLKPV